MEKVEELVKGISITKDEKDFLPGCPDARSKTREAVEVASSAATTLKLDPIIDSPTYIAERLKFFMMLKIEYDEDVASMPHNYICVNIPQYNRSIAEISWKTKPTHIARYLGGEALLEKTVIARVDGVLWDLDRSLESSCTLEFLDFDTPEGENVFRHSSAHLLGQAMELKFDCLLSSSAITTSGLFFYEVGQNSNGSKFRITNDDVKSLQDTVELVISEEQRFERLAVTKQDLLEMFSYNKYKLDQITKIPDNHYATVYRCGPFIDICVGPHIRDIGRIGAFQLEMSPLELLLHTDLDPVYRLYGISFPEQEQLEEHNKRQLQIQLEESQEVERPSDNSK